LSAPRATILNASSGRVAGATLLHPPHPANDRPTYQAPWTDGSGFRELRLDELRDEDVSALTRDLIGDHPSTVAIRDRIVERSGGNPFFAEELIRSLVDSGELGGRPGHYEAFGQLPTETLSATVQTVICARIDRLAPADKEVLQVGATIGREFPLIERRPAYDQRHTCRDGLILDGSELHQRSPGHQVDGGSRAEILVGRSVRDGCAYAGSLEPASNPCSACSAPVRGWASPSAGARCSALSDACHSRGSGPRDRDIRRSKRR